MPLGCHRRPLLGLTHLLVIFHCYLQTLAHHGTTIAPSGNVGRHFPCPTVLTECTRLCGRCRHIGSLSVYHPSPEGAETLHWASSSGASAGTVQILIEHGADVNTTDRSHKTSLH
ncbi:hypothetical protein BJY52DRAFT_1237931 [Lactarius psammicola]|nr:hypothetical protein BJY52DRAFT_1237931 [Lactarius psammicola]